MNDNPFVRLDSRTSPLATRVHDLSSTVARNRFFSTPLVCRWQVKYRGRTKHDSVYHPAVTMVAAWDKKPEIQRTVTHSSGDARHEFRFKPRCVSSSAILARANRPRLGATSGRRCIAVARFCWASESTRTIQGFTSIKGWSLKFKERLRSSRWNGGSVPCFVSCLWKLLIPLDDRNNSVGIINVYLSSSLANVNTISFSLSPILFSRRW